MEGHRLWDSRELNRWPVETSQHRNSAPDSNSKIGFF